MKLYVSSAINWEDFYKDDFDPLGHEHSCCDVFGRVQQLYDNMFSTYCAYFLLIETTFAAEEIIILSHTESTHTTDSAKVFG